jgi:redox-sensitive bicupin YhaK (pirin superfamily)
MVSVIKYKDLGGADNGWLKAKHHFSFASYYNPKRMGFGTIRVINDDIIKAKKGFDPHQHNDMEIITYVRSGAITHTDNQNNEGRTEAGDIQVMSAGTGVIHSEYNLEDKETNIYQIWIIPNKIGVKPRWEAKQFPKDPVKNKLNLLVSGFGKNYKEGTLGIYQDAYVYGGKINKDDEIIYNVKHQAYLLCSYGSVTLDDKVLEKGDAAEILDINEFKIKANEDSEVLVIDAPK